MSETLPRLRLARPGDPPARKPVLNVHARPSPVASHSRERTTNYEWVHDKLCRGLSGPPAQDAYAGRLSSLDVGMRFWTDDIAVDRVEGWYPVVRWTDRWGQRWEHRLGEVRQVGESEPWTA
jgi:hypothetical protein